MDIDRQRISAVRMLALGYAYRECEWLLTYRGGGGGEWLLPVGEPPLLTTEVDSMHGMLMRRADALAVCTEGSDEEAELKTIVDLIEGYEAKRWPPGKDPNVPGGKG